MHLTDEYFNLDVFHLHNFSVSQFYPNWSQANKDLTLCPALHPRGTSPAGVYQDYCKILGQLCSPLDDQRILREKWHYYDE